MFTMRNLRCVAACLLMMDADLFGIEMFIIELFLLVNLFLMIRRVYNIGRNRHEAGRKYIVRKSAAIIRREDADLIRKSQSYGISGTIRHKVMGAGNTYFTVKARNLEVYSAAATDLADLHFPNGETVKTSEGEMMALCTTQEFNDMEIGQECRYQYCFLVDTDSEFSVHLYLATMNFVAELPERYVYSMLNNMLQKKRA